MRRAALSALAVIVATVVVRAQLFTPAPGADPLHRPLDVILDANVRDGMVYYHTLKSQRGHLDRYVASLNVPAATYGAWSKPRQMAFWIDAYNAFVLETIINHYPIHGSSPSFPANSIRQLPGAFDKTTWRAAGRMVTLDQIEKTILPPFGDPRVFLALGRGAQGSGRLRSEAYTADRLDAQLAQIQKEFVDMPELLQIDRLTAQVSVTPILSWDQQAFVAADADKAPAAYAQRSPIERAIIAFIEPNLLPLEKEMLQKNQFTVKFHDMDWRLNDLTGR